MAPAVAAAGAERAAGDAPRVTAALLETTDQDDVETSDEDSADTTSAEQPVR